MQYQLKRPYPAVRTPTGLSYGGNQGWSADRSMKRCGCGVVAALDLLLYLTESPAPSIDSYCRQLETIRRKYLPILYPFGMNGLTLAFGLNRLFLHEGLPFQAEWCFTGHNLTDRIRQLLDADFPVILGVGPQIPKIWKRDGLRFYRKAQDGSYIPAVSVCAHYITITEIDTEWMGFSSWGRKYFIRQDELRAYIRKHSTYLFSNILYIRKREN